MKRFKRMLPGNPGTAWRLPHLAVLGLLLAGLPAWSAPSALRIVDVTGVSGQQVTVGIEMIAQGNENSLGFSIAFDPALMSYVGESAGPGAVGAAFNVNRSQVNTGRAGYAVAQPAGQVFPAGTRELLRLRFLLGPTVTTANVSFGDQPILREIVDLNANPVATGYTNGVITITPLFAPVFTVQPTNQTVYAGATVTMVSAATGSAPLTYIWSRDGMVLPEGTNATLTLPNVATTNSGVYQVVITNTGGRITSQPALLTVLPALVAPAITLQPVSQVASTGETITFVSGASGSAPLRYQWRQASVNLAGRTNATLILSNVTAAQNGNYTLVVSNTVGTATSDAASLTVSTNQRTVRIVTRSVATGAEVDVPIELSGLGDENAVGFSLAFDPSRLVFRSATLIDPSPGAGFFLNTNQASAGRVGIAANRPAGQRYPAGTSQLVLVRFRAGDFPGEATVNFGDAPVMREIADVWGNTRPSVFPAGIVSVLSTPPGIIQDPTSLTVPIFQTATFQMTASGSVPLGYQWQYNGVNLPGANQSSLTLPGVLPANEGEYRVVISNAVGVVTSAVARLTVPRVVRAPVLSAATGTEVDVPVRLLAAGDENAVGFSLVYNPARLVFKEVLSNSAAPVATLNVNTNQAASGALGFALACAGGQTFARGTQSLGIVRFVLPTSGGVADLTFGDNPIARELVDTGTQPLNVVYQGGSVTGVLTRLAFTRQPVGTNVFPGENVFLSAEVSGSRPVTWQWLFNGNPISGATGPSLLLQNVPLTASGNYSVVASNPAGSTNSASAAVQVLPPPSDLAVLNLVAPSTATAGQFVSLAWTVTNVGTSTASGPWRETIYVSDAPDGSNRRAIGTFTFSGALNAAQATTRNVSASLPADLSGPKYFVVLEDSANWLPEVSENNNLVVSPTPTDVRNADLLVASVSSSASAQFGQTINVTWVVRNSGNATAGAPWIDRIYLASQANNLSGATLLRSEPAMGQLVAGASYTNAQSVALPLTSGSTAGTYYLVVAADATTVQGEASEANNIGSGAISLTLPPLPDLMVTNIITPALASPGMPVQLIWTVTNRGTATATVPWTETVYVGADASANGQWLANFNYGDPLPAGAFLIRTQQVTMPLFGSGNRWFSVRVDSADAVIEVDEQNNLTFASSATDVPLAATLTLSPTSVSEGNGASATLTRNGGLGTTATFSLSSADTDRVIVPANISFAANQQAVGFPVTTVEDGWVNGNVLVAIRAQSAGYQSASNALSVLDDDQPTLTLTASTNELLESIGAGVATVTLSRNTSTNNDLIVNLISSDSSRLAAPASVIIPAGARTVSFPLATVDNQSPNAPLRATLTASAAGFAAVPVTFQIIDDDTPLLVLTFADPAITEGAANPATTLTVTRDPVLPARARLGFQSANPGVASVPSTAIILSNQPSVTIPVTVGNNNLVDGRREVTFTAFVLDEATGSPIPGASYTNRLVVNDDDGPTLTIHVNSDIISESGSTTGTVSRNTPATSNLVVKLDSSLTTEATVPSTVTIPVNQSSVNFSINGVPDGVGDGTKRVTITASATGFNSANASLNVSDVDLPDLRPVDITSTNFATTGSVIPVSFTITNNGLSDADGTWVDRIYLARSPAGDGAQMVAQATRFGGLALNTSYTRTLPVGLPETVGNYWLIVRVDETGALNEGTKQNNRLVASSPVEISAAYHAMVETEIDTGFPGSVVPVHGYAYRAHDLSPAPNSRVSVRVLVKGTRRTFSAWSDTQGNFTNWFQMLPNEAGRVSLAADHPGVETDTVQDTVDIYGLRFNSYELTHRIFPNINTTNTVEVLNLGDLPLTGLSASFGQLPSYLVGSVSVEESLPASGKVVLTYHLEATNVLSATIRTHLQVTTAEGARAFVPVTINVQPLTTTLVSTPGFIEQGLLRGEQKVIQFDVSNIGGIPSGNMNVTVPNLPWVTLSSPSNLPSLGPGESTRVTITLTPPSGTPLTIYNASVFFSAENGTLSVPVRFRILSAAQGDLRVEVLDDYTYYVEGAPRVTNATVRLTDPFTGALIEEKTTFPSGAAVFTNLMEGAYQMHVTAEKHSTFAGPVDIVAGSQTDKSVFIDRQTVTYRWSVQPTTIEDKYEIVLEPVFETEVPIPVVTLDNPHILLIVRQGAEGQFDMKFSNHGLVAAEQFTITPPEDPVLEFEPLVSVIDVFPAKSSITVPVKVRHKAAKFGKDFGCGTTFTGCAAIPKMSVKWSWICGPDRRWHGLHAELEFQCASTDCWELIQDLIDSAIGQAKDCLEDAIKSGVINVSDLKDCVLDMSDLACDIVNTLAVCAGITDACVLAGLQVACNLAKRDLGGSAGAAPGLANCICPKFDLPTAPPSSPGGAPPYYSGSGGGGGGNGFGGVWEAPTFFDYSGADCEPGLHPMKSAAKAETRPGGVCARVRIRLEQEVALTRNAFLGSLEIDNESPDIPLTGVQVTMDIRDEDGTNANSRFFIQDPTLNILTAVDGSGVLPAASSGSAKWTFIPTREAAPERSKIYKFGGTLVYYVGTDRVEVPLLPQTLTVFPDPVLNLDYFLQREVFSDDPFTDPIEPAEPFALGLVVRNTGKGKALNFRLTSGQPKVVENEKGLLIDFKIIGTQVSTSSITPSLTLSMGDIDSGKAQVAAFWMTASLQGKFIEYNATFRHADNLGGERTSLIDSVVMHELIHVVQANRPTDDLAIDFLANDVQDQQHLPDTVYFSDGSMAPVELGTGASVDAPATWSDLQVQLTATMPAGWAYLRMPDPGPNFRLFRVVRSDGRPIPVGTNAWTTDRTFREDLAGPVNEDLLHLFDYNSTGTYTLYYRINDAVAPAITSVGANVPPALTSPLSTVDVVFTEAIDVESFTTADVSLSRNGGPNLIGAGVTIAAVETNVYRISGLGPLTGTDGNYQMTVNGAGIIDLGGNPASNSGSLAWAKGSDVPVVIGITQPAPNPRNTAVTNLQVSFSKAVDPATFGIEDLTLSRNGGPNLVTPMVTIIQLATNLFVVDGLTALTAEDGNYQFTVSATAVKDLENNDGQGSLSRSWSTFITGPRIVSLERPNPPLRNIVVPTLDLAFERAINLATFNWQDVTITREGGPNLATADLTVSRVSDTVYRLGNFTWVQGYAGDYALTVSAAGIEDMAGNAGSGTASQSWTLELTRPEPPFRLAITPDLGVSASDGRTCSNNISLSGSVLETNLTVQVYDDTLGLHIGAATVIGTNFTRQISYASPGRHNLRIYAVDEAQNVSSSVYFDTFLDQTPPTVNLQSIAPASRQTPVPSIDATFAEPIIDGGLTLAAFKLSRDGSANLLDASVTLSRVSGSLYRLGNISLLNTQAANYVLTMALTNVQDLAGNRGTGQATSAWTILGESTNRAPTIAAITNRTVKEGVLISFPVLATDPDGGQVLSYSMRAGSPAGASVDTNGLFTWRPNSLQGPATYNLGVVVADDGQPSLSATQTFAIVVEDFLPDVVVALGHTNLTPGQAISVPIRLDSGASLTNLAFEVYVDPPLLGSFVLQSPSTEILGASLEMLETNRCHIRLSLRPGVPPSANRTLLRFGFTAHPGDRSSVVRLHVNAVAATRDNGSAVVNCAGRIAKVMVLGKEPIVDWFDTTPGQRAITVFGRAGATYAIDYATNLGPAAVWTPIASLDLTNTFQNLSLPALPVTVAFFRARELSVSSLLIASQGTNVVIEWSGTCQGCVLQESPAIGSKANWTPITQTPELVNGRYRMPRPIQTTNKFYRLAIPSR